MNLGLSSAHGIPQGVCRVGVGCAHPCGAHTHGQRPPLTQSLPLSLGTGPLHHTCFCPQSVGGGFGYLSNGAPSLGRGLPRPPRPMWAVGAREPKPPFPPTVQPVSAAWLGAAHRSCRQGWGGPSTPARSTHYMPPRAILVPTPRRNWGHSRLSLHKIPGGRWPPSQDRGSTPLLTRRPLVVCC